MTTAVRTEDDPSHAGKANGEFDPDEFRMTIGEHLEELRRRLVFALIGFAVALGVCLFFGQQVVTAFCRPLVLVLEKYDINPQLVTDEVGEGFMTYITISVISAASIASPWILYQLWKFIAAGLYPHERKYVTKYLPLSITLLITGMLFVYFLVLPWTLDFFIGFTTGIPLGSSSKIATTQPATNPSDSPWSGGNLLRVPVIDGDPDPEQVPEGVLYFDKNQQRLKIIIHEQPRVIAINSNNLLAPEIKLSTYISLVVAMLITFGLSFQLPLAVLALERIGIVEIDGLKSGRRYVYFAMVVAAAVITPGDVITATIALMFPLIGLYELGIFLAWFGRREPKPA
jgi:sec-independent protein translocase protein TatC